MGKKSTWFSAIKRAFTSNSKDKPLNEADKTSWKDKKGGRGSKLKHGSFIPLFREPSSIEKILGEVDQQHLFIAHPQQQQQQPQPQEQHHHQQPQEQEQQHHQQLQPKQQEQQSQQQQQQQQQQPSSSAGKPTSPITRPRITSPPPRPASTYPPKAAVHQQTEINHRPQPTLQQQHRSATSIQTAYRGHLARRKVRGLTGHVRLQGVVKVQNVKRQTVNAMKQMQLLVRVQTQIQSRRIQMLENQALKRRANNNDTQVESSLGKNPLEMGDEYWDDSSITKEERETRLQKKMEAVIKRERAMAYAYSHKLGKATPASAQTSLIDIRTGGYPWWWNWLDRQLPSHTPQPPKNRQFTTTSFRTTPDHKLSHTQLDTPTTPMSSRSMAPARTRSRTPPNRMMKYSKAAGGGSPYSTKDDDSLMSCPAFSVPNYMSPTISAKAKARQTSNPKDRVSPSTPGSDTSKRRFSFPFTPDSNRRNSSPRSVGDMSINSAISVPASLGRKPFNRFV